MEICRGSGRHRWCVLPRCNYIQLVTYNPSTYATCGHLIDDHQNFPEVSISYLFPIFQTVQIPLQNKIANQLGRERSWLLVDLQLPLREFFPSSFLEVSKPTKGPSHIKSQTRLKIVVNHSHWRSSWLPVSIWYLESQYMDRPIPERPPEYDCSWYIWCD